MFGVVQLALSLRLHLVSVSRSESTLEFNMSVDMNFRTKPE